VRTTTFGESNPRRLSAGILVTLCIAFAVSAHAISPKRVLLVYEGDGAIPADIAFEQSLVQNLRTAVGSNLEFYREQLDLTRFPDYKEQKVAGLQSQYARRKPDVVVYFGNTLTDVLPGVPVVQVSNSISGRKNGTPESTNLIHVLFNVDPFKVIDVARHFQPKARTILLISGLGPLERLYLTQFQERLTQDPGLKIRVSDSDSIPELIALLSHLPRETIVLPIGYSRDPAGNTYVSRDIVAKLSAISTAPLYAVSDTYVGVGAVGGYVVSWERTGELAADAVVQILRGIAPADVTLSASGSGIYLFDWRELKRWGFSENNLPAGSTVEYRIPTAWEQYRERIVISVIIMAAQFLFIMALLINRKRRRQAEALLRETTGRLLQSQDEERRRIARDLHDGTAQHLAGIALTIGQVLADFPPEHEPLRTLLQDSHVASREALNEVRTVSYVLHPPILDGLGLVPALRWYLDGLQKRTALMVDFKVPIEFPAMTPDSERTIFRIVQEGVTNILRHAGGTAITVILSLTDNSVNLKIEDNGHGMSADQLERVEGAAPLGVGVAGMRERVRQLHGTFKMSSDSRGTRVFVSLPRHEERYAAHSVS
jgi:signal transduction histidine kinase